MSLEKFESVAEAAKAIAGQLLDEELLELYALYKQATVGDVDSGEDAVEADEKVKAKRRAWEAKKGLTQDEAKLAYIEYAEPLIEKANSE